MSHWSYASFFYRTNCIRFASSIFRPLDVTLELCTIWFRIFRIVIDRTRQMSRRSYALFLYISYCIRFASNIFRIVINRPPDVALELCTIQFRIFRVVINHQMSRWSYALFGFVYFVLYQICVEYFSSRNKSTARCRVGVMHYSVSYISYYNKSPDVALKLCTIRFRIFRVVIDRARQMSRRSYAHSVLSFNE